MKREEGEAGEYPLASDIGVLDGREDANGGLGIAVARILIRTMHQLELGRVLGVNPFSSLTRLEGMQKDEICKFTQNH
jgi:hypothetical protein